MTKAALARVIGANKVRRRPFKAGARSAVVPSRAPKPSGPKQPGHKSKTGQHHAGAALC